MPISSNTLFHFTNKYKNLINILENDFRPHYALEDFNAIFPGQPVNYLKLAIPMVSFCDIPLSQTGEHLSTYGCYGIGLTKEWGKRNGITPILYTYPNSLLANSILKLIKHTQRLEENGRDFLYDIFRFIKPYRGRLWRADGIKENVIFYNEREWRYIPIGHKLLLKEDDFLNESERKKFNEDISCQHSIPFVSDDIRYLIVSTEEEILTLISDLEKLKSKFGDSQLRILATRIIPAERIKEDF